MLERRKIAGMAHFFLIKKNSFLMFISKDAARILNGDHDERSHEDHRHAELRSLLRFFSAVRSSLRSTFRPASGFGTFVISDV